MIFKSEEVKQLLRDYDEFSIYSVKKNEAESNMMEAVQNEYYLFFEGMEDKKTSTKLYLRWHENPKYVMN